MLALNRSLTLAAEMVRNGWYPEARYELKAALRCNPTARQWSLIMKALKALSHV